MKRDRLQWNPFFVSGFLMLVLVLVGVLSTTFLLNDRDRILQTAKLKLESHIWLLSEYSGRLFDSIDGTFIHLAKQLEGQDLRTMPEGELRQTVQQAVTYMPDLANCLVLDTDGAVRYVMHPGRASAIAGRYRSAFEAHRDRWEQVVISAQPVEGNELGLLLLSRRLQDGMGRFAGVLLAVVAPSSLYEEYRDYNPRNMDAVLLLDIENRVLAAWPYSLMSEGGMLGQSSLGTLFGGYEQVFAKRGDTTVMRSDKGFALVHTLTRYPLRIAAAYDLPTLLEEWETRRNWLVAMLSAVSVFGMWIAFASYRQRQMLASARAALMQREQHYRTLAENFPAGIIMLYDRDGRVTVAEGQGLAAAGLRKTQMEGHLPDEFFPSEMAALFVSHHAFVLDGKRTTFTTSMRGRVYHAHSQPLLNDRGEVAAGMTVLTDVTRREEYETALRKAKNAAEIASALKGQFVANISHELRTPISGIMGITDVALSEGPPQKWYRHFTIIKNVSDGLLRVINDVLDFSKIEAGKLTLEDRPYHLHELLADIMEAMQLRAVQKGLELRLDIGTEIDPWVKGDPGRLRQVLVNLVENSIKFTDTGHVTVSVQRLGAVRGRLSILFAVTDSGIGIPPERHGDLFDSFSQVDGTLSRQHGGSGLGLSICKHLVGLMGGSLKVESAPGAGSRFSFTLNMSHSAAQQSETLSEMVSEVSETRLFHVLLAEDNPLNQEFLTYFLEEQGHSVSVASNGDEALQLIRQGVPDIVLMDVQMPVVSGLEATRQIRESQAAYSVMPIVALTAHAMAGDRERFLRAGMDAFVGKPVNRADLFSALQEAWSVAVLRGWTGRDHRQKPM